MPFLPVLILWLTVAAILGGQLWSALAMAGLLSLVLAIGRRL